LLTFYAFVGQAINSRKSFLEFMKE
jgi:hypothetical protein